MARIREAWYERTWRPAMAFLYFFLCFLDYAVRPAINIYFFREFDLIEVVQTIEPLENTVQIQIIDTLRSKEAVSPILSEFVHISFGAILGVAAFTRGREELERTKRVDPKQLTPGGGSTPPNPNYEDESGVDDTGTTEPKEGTSG